MEKFDDQRVTADLRRPAAALDFKPDPVNRWIEAEVAAQQTLLQITDLCAMLRAVDAETHDEWSGHLGMAEPSAQFPVPSRRKPLSF